MAKRSGLGRGLDALLGQAAGEVGGELDVPTLRELPVDQVHPNPSQPRQAFDEGELTELADSIERCGVLQPIVVRPQGSGYQIVAGERRYQAACRAGLSALPALVREVSDEDVLKLALIENLQRSDLNAMEAARGYKALVDENGLTHGEVAEVLSKSRSAVSNALRLLELPAEVQTLVEDGALSAGHARAILAVEGEDARSALARKVVADGLTVRQTETLAPLFSVKMSRETQARPATPAAYGQAARRLRTALGAKVRVRTVRGKHKVEIEFGDEDELEALVQKMTGGQDEPAQ